MSVKNPYPKLLIVGVVVTILVVIAAMLAWCVSFLAPTAGQFWGVIALCIPLILGVNCVVMLFWIMRRRWILAVLPLIALCVNGEYLNSVVQISLPSNEEYDLRVASLNVDNFIWKDDIPNTVQEVIDVALRERFDVFSLQEYRFYTKPERADSVADAFRAQLGFEMVHDEGIALVSRFPILASDYKRFEDSGNDYMWADILTPHDTVRIVSVHLQTSGISALRAQYRNDSISREAPVDEVVETLEKNYRLRVRQAKVMRQIIDTTRHRVVLMGDFNDTPSSYTYRAMLGRMNDAFRTSGMGWGGTFRPMLGFLRIDYIFYNDGFRSTDYRILNDPLSDHKLVTADLCFR